jgi:hypothetical protein
MVGTGERRGRYFRHEIAQLPRPCRAGQISSTVKPRSESGQKYISRLFLISSLPHPQPPPRPLHSISARFSATAMAGDKRHYRSAPRRKVAVQKVRGKWMEASQAVRGQPPLRSRSWLIYCLCAGTYGQPPPPHCLCASIDGPPARLGQPWWRTGGGT